MLCRKGETSGWGTGLNDDQVMHAMGIDDAYHVERVLACGAGGTTELVTLDGSGPFVRKRIPSKLARRGVWGALAECECARLPRVEASYEMPDEFVVVCDYVPGQNLEQLVGERGALAEKDTHQLISQLCEAVAALHAHGIIHRDISPRNVVVAADGAHLIDLGIARFTSAGATHDTTQLGTPGFASPEQHGFAQTDARSDVYSLGRLLGYLLTGVMPEVPDAVEYERALTDEKVVRPEMRAIVERASAMEPSARYQSADALKAALAGRPAAGGPSAPASWAPPRQERPRPRRRWPMVVLAAMAALSLAVAIVLLLANAGVLGSAPVADAPAAGAAAGAGEKDGADGPSSLSEGDAGDVGGSSGEAPAADESPIEIVESGWSADDQGYVHYAVALKNTSRDRVVELPAYTITGRAEDGALLFSEEQVLSWVGAGETIYWGGLAGNSGQAPASVEFVANDIQDYQEGLGAESPAEFSVAGAHPVSDGFGGTNFVGEVACERDDGSDYGSSVAISVVLRDDSGAIVFGSTGFASRPKPGESTSFEVSCYDVPDYASYEVYALEW